MNSMARAALTEAKEGALTEFVIEHGARPVKSIKKGIKAAAERAGLKDVSPHVLRHSALTWMAMDGVPIAEISKYAGHGNIMTTQKTYLHHTPGYLSAASESVNLKLVRKVV
jgi:integrase